MKKIGIVLVLLVLLGAAVWAFTGMRGQPTPEVSADVVTSEVFPVFRQSDYQVRSTRLILSNTDVEQAVFASGSGFLVRTSEGIVAVTANHVAEGPELAGIEVDGRQIDTSDGRSTINKSRDRIRLGVKSIRPASLLHGRSQDRNLDVTVMLVDDHADLGAKVFTPGTPSRGAKVTVYGFPSADTGAGEPLVALSNMATREQTITSTESGYFVIEGPLGISPGFSGGPVVDADGKLVGMVVRSGSGQARCVYVSAILEQAARLKTDAVAYRD